MKARKQGTYYTERKPFDTPVIKEDVESDWWIASDIQKEIIKKYGKYIGLSTIGAVAKEYDLVRQTRFGFKLYHKKLVDIIGKGKK